MGLKRCGDLIDLVTLSRCGANLKVSAKPQSARELLSLHYTTRDRQDGLCSLDLVEDTTKFLMQLKDCKVYTIIMY